MSGPSGKSSQLHQFPVHAKGPLPPRSRRGLPVVAVLPFLDLRPEGGEEPLAEGLAEELLQALNQVEGLRVISRTTSFLYGGSGLALAEIGRRLQADAVLGGSLQPQGDLLSVKAELLAVANDQVLWTRTFVFDRKDLFPALEELIQGVAGALKTTPPPLIRRALDLRAYEYYLRGRSYYYRFNRHGMAFAAQMFQRALDLDSSYASAWAGLANCAAYSHIYIERTEAQRELAEACSRRALELDPTLAEAHASRGAALSAAGQAEEAEAAFETALRLDPNLYEAAYFYARHCFAAGKLERAIEYFEWAAALRPEDFQAILLVAQAYHSLGVEDEAERARYLGANALVALGEREKGLAWARLARSMDPDDPMLLYNLGCINALAGEPAEALACLERAVAAGLTQKDWLRHDGDLDALRELPEFQRLLETV